MDPIPFFKDKKLINYLIFIKIINIGNNSNSNQIKEKVYTGKESKKILTLSDINKLSLSVCKIKINIKIQGTIFLIDYVEIGKYLLKYYHVIKFQTLQNKENIKFNFEFNLKY